MVFVEVRRVVAPGDGSAIEVRRVAPGDGSAIEVRRVAPGDGPAIEILAEHHHKAFGHRSPATRVAEMLLHAKTSSSPSTIPMTLIAFCDGELAGSCRICADDFDGKRPQFTPWLATLLVLPAHRGKGVGSALANVAAEEVEDAGDAEAIYLWAIDRVVAEKMYMKLGWSVIEETEPTHGSADIAIVMKRLLQP
eukprot:gene10444-19421_t